MAINAKLPDTVPQHARDLYEKSSLLNSENDLPEIISLLEEAISEYPDSPEMTIKLAVSYRQAGSTGKAIKLLENLSEKCGSNTMVRFELANSYAERKWNKKAKQKYSECLSSEDLTPDMIQEISESCLDMGEYDYLGKALTDLTDKITDPSGTESACVCMAMIYAMMNECRDKQIPCLFEEDYLEKYAEKNSSIASEDFYIGTIRRLSETPNDATILPLFRKIIETIIKLMPSLKDNTTFHKAIADFEISVVLFTNDVTPLTILAMRISKEFFGITEGSRDEIHFLIFDAALALIDAAAKKNITSADTDAFSRKYVYLWQLISNLSTAVVTAPDLKQFFRNYVYNNLKNATPGFCELLKINLPEDQYNMFMAFRNAKPAAVPVRSSKISPNAQCPCGSGKKYKKCCGLKK